MTSLEILALQKAIKKEIGEKARSEITAGDYQIDFVCHIKGAMRVGEDYDSKIVAKADPWLLLAVALSKLNSVTIQSIVAEATSSTLDADKIKKDCEKAIQEIKEPTKQTCKGKVTAVLTTEKITQ